MNDEATILNLVGQIYDAALDPNLWDRFLDNLSGTLKSPGSIFFIQNPESGQLLLTRAAGLDPEAVRDYDQYYASLDPRLARVIGMPEGSVGTEEELVPVERYRRSEFVNDFLLPYGYYHALGANLLHNRSATAILAVQRGLSHGGFDELEIAAFSALVPHLQRAIQMTLRFAQAETKQINCAHLLNVVPVGVILTDQEAHAIHLNDSARQIIGKQDGISLLGGKLCAAGSNETREMHRLVHSASQTTQGLGRGSGGALPMSRPSMLRPFSILVTPLPYHEFVSVAGSPTAAVFVTDPEEETETTVQVLERLYGLTAAEAHLATIVMQGRSLREAADELEIAKETARSQLKSVFSKTDTHRQAELVRLLLRSPAGLHLAR